MPRLAVKIAYDGAPFFGSQRQPGLRTVEQEVVRALQYVKAIPGPHEARFQFAGRTDRGVHAACNVFAVDTAFAPAKLVPALNGAMEDVFAYAVAEVPDAFSPRHAALRRTYEYYLPNPGLDTRLLQDALARFVGEHDFSAFARLEADRDPVRRIHAIDVDVTGPFLLITVTGDSFLWNMVRRIIEAARRVAAGEVPLVAVDDALAGRGDADLGVAPAENLILAGVEYGPEVRFVTSERARNGLVSTMTTRLLHAEFARMFASRVAEMASAVPAGAEPALRASSDKSV